ncbi:MAG TPA: Hsp70 family protein, partial [Saprospiraceae bacterium]|nr:Hsp70 family protein [Saprospiraceae bacterium]
LQGERPMAKDNRSVGRFILDGIPPAPRGVPQVEVSFDIDANGILSVSALDKGTGKSQNIRIEASTGLSKEEVERMKAEAQANADSDKQARERADKINVADTLIFQTDKQLQEFGDKIPAEKKEAIQNALDALKEAHKMQDMAKLDAETERLNQAWQAASQDLYQAQQNAAGGANGNAGSTDSSTAAEDVTDVEYEEVDDKK